MAVLVDGAILQFRGYCGKGHTGVSGHDKIQLIPFLLLLLELSHLLPESLGPVLASSVIL